MRTLRTAVLVTLGAAGAAWAHCDGLDGPVVQAGRKALDAGNVNLALVWIQPKDEAEIRQAFERTLAVRKLSAEARTLADLYFFETLVRVHRAGEGAPYTGMQPAGRDLGPAIPAADKAVANGSAEAVTELLTHALRSGASGRLARVRALKDFDQNDVHAGRDYVKAYVEFLHFIERAWEALASHGHAEPPETSTPQHLHTSTPVHGAKR